jgi:hypothetical protein
MSVLLLYKLIFTSKKKKIYLESGINDFVEKPINSEELFESLLKNIKKLQALMSN